MRSAYTCFDELGGAGRAAAGVVRFVHTTSGMDGDRPLECIPQTCRPRQRVRSQAGSRQAGSRQAGDAVRSERLRRLWWHRARGAPVVDDRAAARRAGAAQRPLAACRAVRLGPSALDGRRQPSAVGGSLPGAAARVRRLPDRRPARRRHAAAVHARARRCVRRPRRRAVRQRLGGSGAAEAGMPATHPNSTLD
eukprot:scaffold86274_cov57-Phaeocystis_antarctica.AAC.2